MPSLIRMSDFAASPRRWLWQDRIPAGCLTVLDGDTGVNKSTLTCEIAARITTGRGMYGSDVAVPPGGVVLLQGEDIPDEVHARLHACGANLDRMFVWDQNDPVVLPDHIPWLEAMVHEHSARLVVVDPVMAFLGPNANSDQSVRRALGPLAAMAERTGASVVLVRHLTKGGGANPLYRGAGSIGLIGAARSGLLVAADPTDPTRRVLATTKTNGSTVSESLSFRPVARADAVAVEWLGVSPYSARSLLEAQSDCQSRSERDDAMTFLYATLSSGPLRAREVLALAVQEGFSRRTLRRAKEALGVVSERIGFGPGGFSRWRLPDEAFAHIRERIADAAEPATEPINSTPRVPDPISVPPVPVVPRPVVWTPPNRRRRILRRRPSLQLSNPPASCTPPPSSSDPDDSP